jgi:hypothetical protein
MPGKYRQYMLWFVVTGALLVAIILTLAGPAKTSSPGIGFRLDPEHPEAERTNAAAVGALVLRRSMRNPDSFELTRVSRFPNGAMCYEYRTRNVLGVASLERAVMPKLPDHVLTESMGGAF